VGNLDFGLHIRDGVQLKRGIPERLSHVFPLLTTLKCQTGGQPPTPTIGPAMVVGDKETAGEK
jgi:hypothetical protein